MSTLRVDTLEDIAGSVSVPVASLAATLDITADLAASTGATLVGYGAGTVASELTAIQAEIDGLAGASNRYADVASATSITLSTATADTFGVALTSNVTTINLGVAETNKTTRVDVLFSQDGVGGHTVSVPSNVVMPTGVSTIASTGAGDVTLARFTNPNGGLIWYYERRGVFTGAPGAIPLPTIADDNASFNDEGLATTGWTASNATLLQSGSTLRQTKTAGGSNSSMSKNITFTPSNTDFILYGKMKAKHNTGDVAVVWLLNGVKEISLWFGSNDGGGSNAIAGNISMVGTTGASTRNIVSIASGYNYETTHVEFALQYDHKFTSLTCWFREADGRWKWRGRVACDWFSSTQMQVLTTTGSVAGTWVEFDYLTLARPNIVSLSDSIGEGKTLFSPDRTLALTNDESTWMRHATIYPALRNNLVVNKGVGGNSSTQILARVADATSTGARVVFLQASSNDQALGVSQGTRTTNIQSTVNAITAASAQTVLLNGVNGTSAGADNQPTPDLRDYMDLWWTTSKSTITGLALDIDVMSTIAAAGNFMDPALTQADGIHPNVAGHTSIGAYITTFA